MGPPALSCLHGATCMSGVDLKAVSQARRKTNRERSCAMLRFLGVAFEVRNEGAHLIVRHEGKTIDFWPGTGKFKPRERAAQYGRGVFNMLKLLGIDPKEKKDQPPCSK